MENNWINVEDRLPDEEKDTACLVYGKYDGIVVRVWNPHYHVWDLEDGDDYYCDAVGGRITHWMPLPDKPI